MKRLLEWKQRMLQSPLTRKSSRNTSRAQTPTNSSSPAPSMSNTGNQQHGDHIRQKVLVELDRHQISSTKMANSNNTSVSSNKSPQQNISNGTNSVNISRKVSRKGSGASRSSRSRSSPRVSNRPTTSSSDEGKSILTIPLIANIRILRKYNNFLKIKILYLLSQSLVFSWQLDVFCPFCFHDVIYYIHLLQGNATVVEIFLS